jgi:hypothetical protein
MEFDSEDGGIGFDTAKFDVSIKPTPLWTSASASR